MNMLTKFPKPKIFVKLKVQSKLIIRGIILILSCIAYFIEQGSYLNRKSVETIAAFVNI